MIVGLIFAILGVIGAIFMLIDKNWLSGIAWLVINGLIGGYLLFSSKVKSVFASV